MTEAANLYKYWLTSAAHRDELSATDCLRLWLDRGIWGVFRTNSFRTKIGPGDHVAFYAARRGVVAFARVVGPAIELVPTSEWPEPTRPRNDVYLLPLDSVTWLDAPVQIPGIADRLPMMSGRPSRARKMWAWVVNSTRQISQEDFRVLTGG